MKLKLVIENRLHLFLKDTLNKKVPVVLFHYGSGELETVQPVAKCYLERKMNDF